MTDGVRPRRRPVALLATLFLVSLWPIVWSATSSLDTGFADVFLYHDWVRRGVEDGIWPMIDVPWVYPFGALAPMSLLAFISDSGTYVLAWWGLILVLNVVVVIVICSCLANGYRAARWWIAFLFLLGPIAFSRVDAVSTALATIALVLISRHPRFATILVALAGWVKVAHFAWLLPLLIITPRRLRDLLLPVTAVSATVMGIGLLLGTGARSFGFLTQQSARGLQAESVFATPLSVARIWGHSGTFGFNDTLKTWEYSGAMANHIAAALDVLLIMAALGVSSLVFLAHRRAQVPLTELIALSTFAMTLVLIVFNKVGSPQFALWLAAPLVLSFATFAEGTTSALRWRFPLVAALALAGLTQVLYPLGYLHYTGGSPIMIIVGATRNLIVVSLLVWAVNALWFAGSLERPHVDAPGRLILDETPLRHETVGPAET